MFGGFGWGLPFWRIRCGKRAKSYIICAHACTGTQRMPRLPQQHNGGRAREREAAGATVRPQRIAPSYFLHQHLLVHLLKQRSSLHTHTAHASEQTATVSATLMHVYMLLDKLRHWQSRDSPHAPPPPLATQAWAQLQGRSGHSAVTRIAAAFARGAYLAAYQHPRDRKSVV